MKHPSFHRRRLAFISLYMLPLVSTYIHSILLLTTTTIYIQLDNTIPIPATPSHLLHIHMYNITTYYSILLRLAHISKKARLTIRPASSAHMYLDTYLDRYSDRRDHGGHAAHNNNNHFPKISTAQSRLWKVVDTG